jgi:hypothetical protein
MTLDDMGKVNLRPNIVIPFRPKRFTAEGLARHSSFTNAVAAIAMEISGRMPGRTSWWRLAKW